MSWTTTDSLLIQQYQEYYTTVSHHSRLCVPSTQGLEQAGQKLAIFDKYT